MLKCSRIHIHLRYEGIYASNIRKIGSSENIFALIPLLPQATVREIQLSEKWKGDQSYLLPALQVEPYRLWFEFLKLAEQDVSLTVSRPIYKSWGEYRNTDFKSWWREHWRTLFATGIGVYEGDVPNSVEIAKAGVAG